MPPSPAAAATITDLLAARRDDPGVGLLFERYRWSWSQHVEWCVRRAALLRSLRRPGSPFHIGVLLDNVPEFAFLLGGAAWSGAVVVGLNPNRRGSALARDIRLADCQVVVTEQRHASTVAEPAAQAGVRVLDIDGPEWTELLARHFHSDVAPVAAHPDDLLALVFTSGTSGDPKAVRCTHAKIAQPGRMLADRFALGAADVVYVSMPLFHSNALIAGWSVGLAAGAGIALRRKFSPGAFLDDVRAFGATYANYVGRPLSLVLDTPRRHDDRDNPLRLVYGNEGAERDLDRFAERFGCRVVDGFGSTEGGVSVQRTPDSPPGALGVPAEGVTVLDPETSSRCPPATFDAAGRVTNPDEAIGELVNTSGAGLFAGYYGEPEADEHRMRGGMYWSGDRAYLDAHGFCYFAGRTDDWMRVDGENLTTAPVERALLRHPAIAHAAVYAVPDRVGDQVMAAVVPAGEDFDVRRLGAFLAEQEDLGAKQRPVLVRVCDDLPRTATHKVVKRELVRQRWNCPDEVWRREPGEVAFRPLTAERAAELDTAIDGR